MSQTVSNSKSDDYLHLPEFVFGCGSNSEWSLHQEIQDAAAVLRCLKSSTCCYCHGSGTVMVQKGNRRYSTKCKACQK